MDSLTASQSVDSINSLVTSTEMLPSETTSSPQRKKRVTLTKELLQIIMCLHENEPVLTTMEIANAVEGPVLDCNRHDPRRRNANKSRDVLSLVCWDNDNGSLADVHP